MAASILPLVAPVLRVVQYIRSMAKKPELFCTSSIAASVSLLLVKNCRNFVGKDAFKEKLEAVEVVTTEFDDIPDVS